MDHLDSLEPEVERLAGLGATVLRHIDETVMGFTNTLDPHGNELCVCAPHVPATA